MKTKIAIIAVLSLITPPFITHVYGQGISPPNYTKIRSLVENCEGGSTRGYGAILLTYIDQIEFLDYDDQEQNSYASNAEVRRFVMDSFREITQDMSNCSELQQDFFDLITFIKNKTAGSIPLNQSDRLCSPLGNWRSCKVVTNGGGLNLRRMPGALPKINLIDGFVDGTEVRAVCTFGNWALVYGDTLGSEKDTYGWSHRDYLNCSPDLEPANSEWSG